MHLNSGSMHLCKVVIKFDCNLWKYTTTTNVQVLSYIILPHNHTLVNTTNSGGYLGSTVGGEYVAKPTLSLWLYNLKTQGLSYYFLLVN